MKRQEWEREREKEDGDKVSIYPHPYHTKFCLLGVVVAVVGVYVLEAISLCQGRRRERGE